ncbi:unnamed protein product [Prunus armeniaca]|uniref:Uncharacterized protein n=1 Tax=Prunus armeniaca TaxID=36596 RepID=A0A6J5Y0E3_PRUAR|nr:unnamed protein product [Prunus armeniaca]
MEMVKVGYEVYADGPTRDGDDMEPSAYKPILAARIGNINFDSLFTHEQKFSQICVQSVNLEHKWVGAPFAAMLRRMNPTTMTQMTVYSKLLLSSFQPASTVDVSWCPLDCSSMSASALAVAALNLFLQTFFLGTRIQVTVQLRDSKVLTAQCSKGVTRYLWKFCTLKMVPAIKNKVVELNGVMVTHALITMRELTLSMCTTLFMDACSFLSTKLIIRYAMRAIYIAKGSPLLPPDFVSIFDDLAHPLLMSSLILPVGSVTDTFANSWMYPTIILWWLYSWNSGSNVLLAAITEISDSVLKGAEARGDWISPRNIEIAMEPSLLGTALMEGGPDRKIKLDRSPVADELYIEGYLQAMLDTVFRQEYLRVRVIDNQDLSLCLVARVLKLPQKPTPEQFSYRRDYGSCEGISCEQGIAKRRSFNYISPLESSSRSGDSDRCADIM